MAQFYTFEELQDHFPTRDAVVACRDRIIAQLGDYGYSRRAVVFGSSMWGLHKKLGAQHTFRSDVDVGVAEIDHPGIDLTISNYFHEIAAEFHVPVQVTIIGKTRHYQTLVSPSTRDHFRLLQKRFPQFPYADFLRLMKPLTRDRVEDLQGFVNFVWGIISDRYPWCESFVTSSEFREKLSMLENAPDHLLRKFLGLERRLPCPDSKVNTRKVFFSEPHPLRTSRFDSCFEQVLDCTARYEHLMMGVKDGVLTEDSYNLGLQDIIAGIRNATYGLFDEVQGLFNEPSFRRHLRGFCTLYA